MMTKDADTLRMPNSQHTTRGCVLGTSAHSDSPQSECVYVATSQFLTDHLGHLGRLESSTLGHR